MSTNNIDKSRREGLPLIQLPPPIVHFYTAPMVPPPIDHTEPSPHASPAWHQPNTNLPPTPPASVKENHRRTSHSAVEKRRRERMNDKIEKLKHLIPSCNAQFPTSVQQPIHKLSVLQAAIDYINELHQTLENSLPEDIEAVIQKKKNSDEINVNK